MLKPQCPVCDQGVDVTDERGGNGHGVAEDVAHTIDGANGQAVAHTLRADGFDASEDGTGRGTPLVAAFTERTRSDGRNFESQEEPAGPGRRWYRAHELERIDS